MTRRTIPTLAVGLTLLLVAGLLSPASSQTTLPEFTVEDALEIANVDAPPAGVGLKIHADFPTEAPLALGDLEIYALTLDITPEGQVITSHAVTSDSASSNDSEHECDDPAFSPMGVVWDASAMPISWRFNAASVPDYLRKDYTLRSARRGHRTWTHIWTNCDGMRDNTFTIKYLGKSRRHIKYDNVNVVDFGSLGSGALAIAYTWYSGSKIIEVDLRLNKHDYKWTNRRDVNTRYEVVNVAAHEYGHHLGLEDLTDPHGGLTMFGRIGLGEHKKLSLGRGDIVGSRAISP
jgi:hypothetical protein